MADPFAAALDRLHASVVAKPATFTPAIGAPIQINVIRSQPSEELQYEDQRLMVETEHAQIRRADVADPSGGALTIGTEHFLIQGTPRLDIEGLTWLCALQPA